MPLTSIQGYSSALLLDEIEWGEDKRREVLRLIESECIQMQDLLKEIIDSSLIDVNQLVIERQPVLLPNIARAVAEEMQRRTDAHQILVDFPPGFPT
jgi:K+-sensing histidine kinase KdpD